MSQHIFHGYKDTQNSDNYKNKILTFEYSLAFEVITFGYRRGDLELRLVLVARCQDVNKYYNRAIFVQSKAASPQHTNQSVNRYFKEANTRHIRKSPRSILSVCEERFIAM
jgi:hypothetical protein